VQTTYRVSHLSDPRQVATSLNIARRKTDALDLSSDQATLLVDRPMSITGGAALTANLTAVNVDLTGVYKVATIQVVGARSTGWTADTGTAEKGAKATYTAPTISNPPTQTEVQNIANAVQGATRELKALKDALLTHGLIGT
jgi:hypothetical protein